MPTGPLETQMGQQKQFDSIRAYSVLSKIWLCHQSPAHIRVCRIQNVRLDAEWSAQRMYAIVLRDD